jgi:hypothetical protein
LQLLPLQGWEWLVKVRLHKTVMRHQLLLLQPLKKELQLKPYNETVTIDGATEGGTGGGTESTFAAPEEKKERLRVYSGKHDGVNVIVDPR